MANIVSIGEIISGAEIKNSIGFGKDGNYYPKLNDNTFYFGQNYYDNPDNNNNTLISSNSHVGILFFGVTGIGGASFIFLNKNLSLDTEVFAQCDGSHNIYARKHMIENNLYVQVRFSGIVGSYSFYGAVFQISDDSINYV